MAERVIRVVRVVDREERETSLEQVEQEGHIYEVGRIGSKPVKPEREAGLRPPTGHSMSCMSAETSYMDPLWRLRQICVYHHKRRRSREFSTRPGKARCPQAVRRDGEPRRSRWTLGGAPPPYGYSRAQSVGLCRWIWVGPEEVESDVGWAMGPGCRFGGCVVIRIVEIEGS